MHHSRVGNTKADPQTPQLNSLQTPTLSRSGRSVWYALPDTTSPVRLAATLLIFCVLVTITASAHAAEEPMDPAEIMEPEPPTRDTMPGDQTHGGEPVGHRQIPRETPAESPTAPPAPTAPAETEADDESADDTTPMSEADTPEPAAEPKADADADTDDPHADDTHTDGDHAGGGHGKSSRISDDLVPDITMHPRMERPKPILELGPAFLGTGKIDQGIELPTGAVWQPQFVVFGTYRTALQVFDNGIDTQAEWANRLDLFGNLQLSGTERLLIGIRPLDDDGVFTGYYYKPDDAELDGFEDGFSLELSTLFFEGDLGEIFPNLDPDDTGSLDLGFSIGRQPLFYQEGLLINDDIDAIGVIRNTLLPAGGADLQATFLYGWNEIHRGNNVEANDTNLFGIFTQADIPTSTINVDLVYVHDDEADNSGFFWGASTVQRIGHYNTAFRLVGSHATDGETAAVQDGVIAFGEVSWTPPWGHDLVYVNGFVGIDNFRSAARGPATGGPLGRTGLLFAAIGLGRYGAPLDNNGDRSVGAAMGYQIFLDDQARQQIVFEGGVRVGTDDDQDSAIAAGARYQRAFGQNYILQLDSFVGARESRDMLVGGRVEFRIEF